MTQAFCTSRPTFAKVLLGLRTLKKVFRSYVLWASITKPSTKSE
jgi:hypothetical protein